MHSVSNVKDLNCCQSGHVLSIKTTPTGWFKRLGVTSWTVEAIQLLSVLVLLKLVSCFDCCLWDRKVLQKVHLSKLNSTSDFLQDFGFIWFYCSAHWGLTEVKCLGQGHLACWCLSAGEFSFKSLLMSAFYVHQSVHWPPAHPCWMVLWTGRV